MEDENYSSNSKGNKLKRGKTYYFSTSKLNKVLLEDFELKNKFRPKDMKVLEFIFSKSENNKFLFLFFEKKILWINFLKLMLYFTNFIRDIISRHCSKIGIVLNEIQPNIITNIILLLIIWFENNCYFFIKKNFHFLMKFREKKYHRVYSYFFGKI